MLTVMCMATLLSAAAGSAEKAAAPAPARRLAVVAFGGCAQGQLAEATRGLRTEIARVEGDGVLGEDETAQPGGGLARTTLEEVRRAIDSGRTQFLNLNLETSQKTLRTVIPEVDRLPLGPQRWDAYWTSRVHLARVLQYLDQRTAASALFLEILRVQEDFNLNRIEFPPSTRDLLELTRSLLTGLPRFKLEVTSRRQGQPVYVNGYAVGKTPLEKRLVSGAYEVVVVGEGSSRTFSRSISLHSDHLLEVDVERESGFRAELGPCFEAKADREARLVRISTLAAALDVDRVVAVRIEQLGEERYLAAALVEVGLGREVREGRVRLEATGLPRLEELSRFVMTGEQMTNVVEAPAGWDARAESGASSLAGAGPSWKAVSAIVLAGAALALGGVGLYQHFEAEGLVREAESLRGEDGKLSYLDKERHDGLLAEADEARALRNGLAVGSAAATVGAGVFLGLALVPDRRGELALSLSVAGSF